MKKEKQSELLNNERKWHLFNLDGKVLGRASSEIATILQGKKKLTYDKSRDCGDYVIAINAEKIKLTGSKIEQKKYYFHTGYIGNLKSATAKELMKKDPGKVILHSVAGMLPKNKIKNKFLSRLKIYTGSVHPHVNIKIDKEY